MVATVKRLRRVIKRKPAIPEPRRSIVPGSGALTGGKGIGVPPPGGMVKPPPKPPPVPVPPSSWASTEQITAAYGDGIGVHGHSTGMGQHSTALIGCPCV
jgi:hypothetical protein